MPRVTLAGIWKPTWQVIGVAATISGALGFAPLLFGKDDFALTVTVTSREKLIENVSRESGPELSFNGQRIGALYRTTLEVANVGRRAIGRDAIYEPITVSVGADEALLRVKSSDASVSNSPTSIVLRWELLNPGERIEVEALSERPLHLKIAGGRIKDIAGPLVLSDAVARPTAWDRVVSLGAWLPIVVGVSVLGLIDGLLLLLEDVKLGNVFGAAETSIPTAGSISREDFLSALRRLYEDYYRSAHVLLVKPDSLVQYVRAELPNEMITAAEVPYIRKAIYMHAVHGNLYNLRGGAFIWAPALLTFCLARVVVRALFGA
jgi:hypothetical protein